MLIPLWYAGWEHPCCGPDICLGDFVEWVVYWEIGGSGGMHNVLIPPQVP